MYVFLSRVAAHLFHLYSDIHIAIGLASHLDRHIGQSLALLDFMVAFSMLTVTSEAVFHESSSLEQAPKKANTASNMNNLMYFISE